MRDKHMADGRPALVIGIAPKDHEEPEAEEHGSDGLEVAKALIAALHAKDADGVWEALKAAHACAADEDEPAEEPSEDEELGDYGEH